MDGVDVVSLLIEVQFHVNSGPRAVKCMDLFVVGLLPVFLWTGIERALSK